MFDLLVILGGSGGLLVLVAWAIGVWWHRRRFMRRVERHACIVCGTPFTEAIAEYRGRVTAADRAGLDRFQNRFAAYTITCLDCDSVNICTKDGQPFRGRMNRVTT